MSFTDPTDPKSDRLLPNQTARDDDPPAKNERYEQALKYLYDRINYERIVEPTSRYKFRLQRITELLRRLGLSDYLYTESRPEPKIPLVHIAGTKGKGSTAAMVSAAISASGLRTGLYTSPHLHRLEERFCIDSVPCSEDELVDLVRRIAGATEAVERELGPPSFFELTTALAILHFHLSECDAIVLEVGLGGRLDSTNVCAPSVSVITSIGLDHQLVLGDSLTEIAAEKAGIIKAGVPVVSGVIDSDAAAVVAGIATEKKSELFQLGKDFDYRCLPKIDWGSKLDFESIRSPLSQQISAGLQMEGVHQGHNAAIAIASLNLLRDQGVAVSDSSIQTGLNQLNCIGRIERFALPAGVTGIVDAAHNDDSITALCDTLRRRCADRPVAVVFGTSIDKDAESMLSALAEVTERIVLTRFWGNPRYCPTQKLVQQLPTRLKSSAKVIEHPVDACTAALQELSPGGTLVVCGSFFLAAETRGWFGLGSGIDDPVEAE
jgi:dihydrofolate synthase/folylpolyglutamate synthase